MLNIGSLKKSKLRILGGEGLFRIKKLPIASFKSPSINLFAANPIIFIKNRQSTSLLVSFSTIEFYDLPACKYDD